MRDELLIKLRSDLWPGALSDSAIRCESAELIAESSHGEFIEWLERICQLPEISEIPGLSAPR